ncbi:MAG: thioredoxin family protein [Candidatus Omnitrophica bacterium]|jgi:cytochrome c biogenesis protein CcdA/glutaredoxin|nr:thioredoxin family protein [Candidatus Omnitrophota bacterium]MDD5079566.1 thioredoxin family protein [Candidatus Omnitrophota bacterium]
MIKKIIILNLFSLCIATGLSAAPATEKPKLVLFHSVTCHECAQVRDELLPGIREKYKNNIDIEYRDIADIENYKLLLGLKERYKVTAQLRVPVIFIAGKFLSGKQAITSGLDDLILQASVVSPGSAANNPEVDLVGYFLGFTPLAVVSAGLIDGINPCAFTVIVFFISFLALQGYRRRELLVIGVSFIFAVFLTYLLLGLGLFSFFYSLKGFWIIRRGVNLAVGGLSLCLAVLAFWDFLKYKRTGNTEGMSLQLPQAVKNRIRAVIGRHYRKPKDGVVPVSQKHILSLVLSALISGFLVSILEAVCTGQVYLPTIAFVLKAAPIKLQAWGYLLLYNLMFILPLVAVFVFSMMGASSQDFSRVLKKNFLAVKILMAALFFSLGAFIIWRG